ncbi:MAG TPA: type II toxin-antitoxin system VapC family toxin [Saprospiraceae bacterium]|nr:type II toxin-antitoxin system VapC family toxin [Saprospiraceae bacterium]HMP13931.1 type II toxin-antitoxin system VapC family toxin [Saprospiraceae bacterium]
MKRVAIDTNIAIELLNNNSAVISHLQYYEILFLPVIVSGELLFGAKNSSNQSTNLAKFRAFINACEELAINNLVADAYANVRLSLKQKGKPIPENDIWIAAICMTNDLPLLTRDAHFKFIDSLKVETLST